MKFDVEIAYGPKASWSAKAPRFTIPIDLPLRVASDLVVVAEYEVFTYEHHRDKGIVHAVDGRFVRQVVPAYPDPPKTADWLTHACRGGIQMPDSPFAQIAADNTVHDVSDQEAVDRVKAKVEAEVRRRAGDLLFLEGLLWEFIEEPRLVAWQLVTGDSRATVEPAENTAGRSSMDLYRLDQMDALLQMHERVHTGRPIEVPALKVFRPDLLKYRSDERCLLDVSRHLLRGMRQHVADGSRAFLMGYADLRDATVALGNDLTNARGGDPGYLAEVMQSAVEAVEREGVQMQEVVEDVGNALYRAAITGLCADPEATPTFR